MAWIVTFFYLKETVSTPISFSRLFGPKKADSVASLNEPVELPESEKPFPLRRLLTRAVIVAASNYAFLSLVDITFRAVYPVFLFTPIHLGGLGLPTSTIGSILSVYGLFNGVFQVFCFARIHEYLGSKTTFILGIASALPAFACFPLMSYLARAQGMTHLVWAIAVFQILISIGLSFSYGKQQKTMSIPLFTPFAHGQCFTRGGIYLHFGCIAESSVVGCDEWPMPAVR